jgi:hypothetical protein
LVRFVWGFKRNQLNINSLKYDFAGTVFA